MGDALNTKQSAIRLESVTIGDGSSRLSGIIFFLLCAIPVFSTIFFGGVDNVTWIFVSIFGTAIVLLWLTEAWRARGFIFDPSVLQLPIVGLIIVGLIQLLPIGPVNSANALVVPSSNALSLDPYATRFFIGQLVIFFIFFACCLTFINNEKRLKKVVLLVVVFGAAMAFLGILQRLADPGAIYGLRVPFQAVPFGPFVNQHHFAAFMEMTAGVTFALVFEKTFGRDKKILLAIALVLMVVALVLTSSRGGMLSLTGVFSLVLLINLITNRSSHRRRKVDDTPGRRNMVPVVAGIAGLAVILAVVLFLGGDESLFRGIGISNVPADVSNGRTHFWSGALKIFLEHPILGAGLDAFGVAFTKHDTWNGVFRVERAHNDYLQILADAGITGFASVVVFIYFLFKKGLRTISSAGNNFRGNAAIGSLAGCLGILIHSFVDFPLRTPSNAFFFLLLAAIATVSIKTSNDGDAPRRRKRRSSAQ